MYRSFVFNNGNDHIFKGRLHLGVLNQKMDLPGRCEILSVNSDLL